MGETAFPSCNQQHFNATQSELKQFSNAHTHSAAIFLLNHSRLAQKGHPASTKPFIPKRFSSVTSEKKQLINIKLETRH